MVSGCSLSVSGTASPCTARYLPHPASARPRLDITCAALRGSYACSLPGHTASRLAAPAGAWYRPQPLMVANRVPPKRQPPSVHAQSPIPFPDLCRHTRSSRSTLKAAKPHSTVSQEPRKPRTITITRLQAQPNPGPSWILVQPVQCLGASESHAVAHAIALPCRPSQSTRHTHTPTT